MALQTNLLTRWEMLRFSRNVFCGVICVIVVHAVIVNSLI